MKISKATIDGAAGPIEVRADRDDLGRLAIVKFPGGGESAYRFVRRGEQSEHDEENEATIERTARAVYGEDAKGTPRATGSEIYEIVRLLSDMAA